MGLNIIHFIFNKSIENRYVIDAQIILRSSIELVQSHAEEKHQHNEKVVERPKHVPEASYHYGCNSFRQASLRTGYQRCIAPCGTTNRDFESAENATRPQHLLGQQDGQVVAVLQEHACSNMRPYQNLNQ